MSSPFEYAVRYVSLGWPVFSLPAGSKVPPRGSAGFKDATTSEAMLRRWWRAEPKANVGTPTGAIGWVLDVDPRHGGTEALEALLARHGPLPDTLVARTPSGGWHYWFAPDPRARNTAGKLGPGLDTRGEGGYVLVEGSATAAGKYQFLDWDPLTEPLPELPVAPEWLMALAFPDAPQSRQDAPGPRGNGEGHHDPIQEGGRNAALASLAGAMRRKGMTPAALEAALLVENAERCRPPLPDAEVRAIAASVGRYAPAPVPSVPTESVPPVPPIEAYETATPRWEIRPQDGSSFADAFRPLPDLIPGILRTRYIYALTAPTNAGKTALCVHLALRLALGMEFAGHILKPSRVLYLAGENPYDVQARLLAECQVLGISPHEIGDQITVIAQSFQLPTAVSALADAVRERGEYKLVIVDTVPAYAWYEEENSNAEARGMAMALRSIESMVPGNPTVLAPCHPRKGATREDLEPRGGGAFLAELDGNLTCWLADGVVEFGWQKKLRQAGFAPLKFKVSEVALEDRPLPDGTPYTTVGLEWIDERSAEDLERKAYEFENRILYEMLRNQNGNIRDWSDAAGIPKTMGHRIILHLVREKLVKQHRNRRFVLTELGKIEAESIR